MLHGFLKDMRVTPHPVYIKMFTKACIYVFKRGGYT